MNAKCCEQAKGTVYQCIHNPGRWWMEDPHGTLTVAYCPFCGHDLSRPVYDSLEEWLQSLVGQPPLDIVFDVDGVLCDDRDQSVRYADRPPYPWVARTLSLLKEAGHTLRIQTARYMKRFDGDQRKASEYGGQELRWWLRENGIPYDEVYLGKASGHLYVDDRGCRVESNRGSISWLNSLAPTLAATQARKAKTT